MGNQEKLNYLPGPLFCICSPETAKDIQKIQLKYEEMLLSMGNDGVPVTVKDSQQAQLECQARLLSVQNGGVSVTVMEEEVPGEESIFHFIIGDEE